ncbi:MAG: N-acetylneuraminate synthase family protein [Phycisphaerales bacterium]|nr:N-acetylneuraminate synthase family protein [Phycisphaerales bacterium]
MRIGTRQIGDGAAPYIIAEIGVNHDGSPARAMELVEAAAESGADAIKLQLFRTDLLMSRAAGLAAYQAAAGERDPFAMLRRLELLVDDMAPLVARAHALGIHAIVTVFSLPLVPEADRLPWDAYKSASPDIIHKPLLGALAATGRPMIVSTGAAESEEVARAVGWLAPAADRLALLQCVSCYPTPPAEASIAGMAAIRDTPNFRGPVGYSDHTAQTDTGGLAAAAGAAILEKHLTYSKAAAGPDHAASLEPAEFRVYAQMAKDEGAMQAWTSGRLPRSGDPRYGPPVKRILECERDVRRASRQSIVAARDLPAGAALSERDIAYKRPGGGLEPWQVDHFLGRHLLRPVAADTGLVAGDLRP